MLAQTRLFTSKGLRERTRRQYQNLPEVRQKQHVENENKIRKNHRIFADMFNKVIINLISSFQRRLQFNIFSI